MGLKKKVFIGTRGSKLALAQANQVQATLSRKYKGFDFAIQVVKTLGDTRHDKLPEELDRTGIFTAELDHALLNHHIDLAVHSLKDLPSVIPDGLAIAAITKRIAVHDVMLIRKDAIKDAASLNFRSLPAGLRIGTSSLRRRAVLMNQNPGLSFLPLRGNLDTRLRKLAEGQMDAVIVAQAGLMRLKLDPAALGFTSLDIPLSIMLPAAGQAALAIEIRAGDQEIQKLTSILNHEPTALCIQAERSAMARLGLGCRVPAGFLAHIQAGVMMLVGEIAHPDGTRLIREKVKGPADNPAALGEILAEKLLTRGAGELVAVCRT